LGIILVGEEGVRGEAVLRVGVDAEDRADLAALGIRGLRMVMYTRTNELFNWRQWLL
jgi:hypothetical protein